MGVQAAIDKAKAAQGTAQKRPTFRRPTTKPPAPAAAPAEEEEAEQPSKKPRLDSLFQQSAAQPQNPHEHVANDGTDAPQAWSPTQHTNLPYSPGNPEPPAQCVHWLPPHVNMAQTRLRVPPRPCLRDTTSNSLNWLFTLHYLPEATVCDLPRVCIQKPYACP